MSQDFKDEVRGFIAENFLFGDTSRMPDDDESLLAAGVVDSTGVLELIEFLEDAASIRINEAETVMDNLGSISAMTRFVERKRSVAAPA